MVKFAKIENHPDIASFVERTINGESPLKLSQWTMETYPTDFTKQIDNPQFYRWRQWRFPKLKAKNLGKQKQFQKPVLPLEEPESAELSEEEVEGPLKFKPPAKLKRRKRKPSEEIDDIGNRLMRLTGREPPPPTPRRLISDEKLMSWIDGVDGFDRFVSDMIHERGINITLQDYQREIAQAFMDYTRVVVCAGGQVGKDLMIMAYSIWLALMNPGSSQLILCSTQTQSASLMDRTMENINMDSELSATILNTAKKPEYVVFFTNGSRIYYLTAQSRIAGKTNILCAWVNEARDINEEEVTRVTPLLGIAGGRLYVLSRPRFRQGYFWDIYHTCETNPRFKAIKIPTDRNKFFDKQVYEDDRATYSPDLFKIEYLAEFADAGSSYFSELAIDKCSRAEYDYKGMNPEPEYDYSLGIDWARLRDTCVLTVIGKRRVLMKSEPDFKVFHLFSFSPEGGEPSTFDHHFAYIQLLDNKFNFKYIIPESSGMGIPLSDRLQSTWNRERRSGVVRPYENRSLQAKLEMYEYTKHTIETGNLEMPRNADRLINELKMTQFGATLHGTLRIETPITDDFADCLCLSLIAWKQPFEIGIATVRRPGPTPDIYTRNQRLG